jgi:peptidoglycan/xylan/chitin deacetylase (PgdA/CDA1 family)
MFIPLKISRFLHFLFPKLTFHCPNREAKLFLTFDDGPTPGITEFVLSSLEEYNGKATFFCTGENVQAYPDLYEKIIVSGNKTGNHGWKHSDAFKVKNSTYLKEVECTEELIGTKLFRPPYGRLWPWQYYKICRKYKIIMWDIMFPDYKAKLDGEVVIERLFPRITEGSIIVMHDSLKSSENLYYLLPRLLEEFTRRGFIFESFPPFD